MTATASGWATAAAVIGTGGVTVTSTVAAASLATAIGDDGGTLGRAIDNVALGCSPEGTATFGVLETSNVIACRATQTGEYVA